MDVKLKQTLEPFSNADLFRSYNEVLFMYASALCQPAYDLLENHLKKLCQIEEQFTTSMSSRDR